MKAWRKTVPIAFRFIAARVFRSVASKVVDLHEGPATELFSLETDACFVGAGTAGLSLDRAPPGQGRTVPTVVRTCARAA
jgi:hypothetical protein